MGKERPGRETIALIRLHAVVEGQTEETFVREVLALELGTKQLFVDAHRVTTGRRRGQRFRGGLTKYQQLKNDLVLWMKQDQNKDARFTTMVDLYRLPLDFPGFDVCKKQTAAFKRVQCLEQQFEADLSEQRFIPYIQLHEFEALLFSEVEKFGNAFPGRPKLISDLRAIKAQFDSPEHINDRPDLAPSKRILELIPEYEKPF